MVTSSHPISPRGGPEHRKSARRARPSRSPEAVQAWRRAGVVPALAAAIVGSLAGALWYVMFATRPPCPPGWVRFLDWGPFMSWVGAIVVALALVTAVLAGAARGSRVVAVLACLLLGAASLLLVWASYAEHQQQGQTYASGCLTFDRVISSMPRARGGPVPAGESTGRRLVPAASW
jgi:hypothetical protein